MTRHAVDAPARPIRACLTWACLMWACLMWACLTWTCLALAACGGDVHYRGPSVRYDGPANPVALVAVGAVMAVELGLLAAPAFHYQGTKPRSRAVAVQATRPQGSPDVLVLLTLNRGPAQDLGLDDWAEKLRRELEGLGIVLAPAQAGPVDADAFGYARLAQRGLARVVVVGLDASADQGQALVRLELVDVARRERLDQSVLRQAVADPAAADALAEAHAALLPGLARAVAQMLTQAPPGLSPVAP